MSFKPFENLNNENEDTKKANLLLMVFFTAIALAAMIFVPFAGFAGLAFITCTGNIAFSFKQVQGCYYMRSSRGADFICF